MTHWQILAAVIILGPPMFLGFIACCILDAQNATSIELPRSQRRGPPMR